MIRDALTSDDAYVYWTELDTVYRASKTAPVRERLFGDGTAPSTSIVVDEQVVYALDNIPGSVRAWPATDDSVSYRIYRSNLDGTGAAQLVGATTSTVYQLVAERSDAYWTDERGLMSSRGNTALYAASNGGYVAAGLSVIGDSVYVTEMPYPMGASGGKVLRVPRDGSAPSQIATVTIDGPANAFRVYGVRQTNDATSLYVTAYWTSDTGSTRGDTISRVALR